MEKIKEMPRSLFYDIPCYVTMDYERWYTSRAPFDTCEEIRVFEFKIMSIICIFHVSDMVLTLYISYKHVRKLLFQVNFPLLEHFVDKNR